MARSTDPASETMQTLARRWMGLVHEFSGGNPEIEKAVQTMYQQEPDIACRNGIDRALLDYIEKATAAAKQAE